MSNTSSIDRAPPPPVIDNPVVVRPPQPAPPVATPKRPLRRLLTRKRAIIAGIVIVLAFVVWRALRPAAFDVDLAQATAGAMQVTVNADAVTRGRAHFAVTAPVVVIFETLFP